MSDKITLQNLSAEQEADRLLAEEDEASRNNVLRDGLQELEEEENLPPPATQNQTAAVSLQLPHRSLLAAPPVAAPPCLPISLPNLTSHQRSKHGIRLGVTQSRCTTIVRSEIADESNCATQVKRIHPAPIIAIWIALSSSVILMNAWVLGNKEGDLNFPYPIFLTVHSVLEFVAAKRTLIRISRTDHSSRLRHHRYPAYAEVHPLNRRRRQHRHDLGPVVQERAQFFLLCVFFLLDAANDLPPYRSCRLDSCSVVV